MKKITLNQYLKEKLKNPDFRKQWAESEIQYQVTRQLVKARLEKNLSQRNLAKKAKTTQAVISRIENMSVNPSLDMLEKIAGALDKKLQINFVNL